MPGLPPDVRGALRSLGRSPAFLTLAALTLGLGAGVAGAMSTLVRRVVLEPLPVRDESTLVVAWGDHRSRGFDHFPYSYAAWERIGEGMDGVARLAGTDAWGASERLIESGDGLSPVRWSRVLGDFFGVLGVEPVLGRVLSLDDDVSGGPRVAVVSWGLWMRRWGGARSVIGETLTVNGESYTVVGVLPRAFDFPRGTEVWSPTRTGYAAGTTDLPRMELDLVARLAPGVGAERFAAGVDRVTGEDAELSAAYADVTPVVRPFREVMLGDIRPVVLLLFAGGLLLLTVAAVNVANLVLIRAGERSGSTAVRSALGASRARIALVPMVEAAGITTVAGLVAACVAIGGMGALLPLAPGSLPILDTVRPDRATWLGTAGVLLVFFVTLSWLPVVFDRMNIGGGMPQAIERSGRRARRFQTVVVTAQTALAVWTVVASALLVRSMLELKQLDTGFDEQNLYVVQIDHRHDMFSVPADWPDRLRAASDELLREPGIVSASPVLVPPLVANGGYDIVPEIEGESPADRSLPYVNFETVLPGYFETLRLPVVEGRRIETTDVRGSMPVAIVNRAAADALWPGEDAIGKRVALPWPGYEDVMWTVVGVAGDARYRALLDVRPSVYVPVRQMNLFATRWMAVRTNGAVDLADAVRNAFSVADPGVRVVGATSVPERLSAPLARPRFALGVLGTIALIIVILAGVGAYGTMAAGVRGRTRELGIRMACGATPASIGALVLREATVMAGIGAIVGGVMALATGRFVESLLFGVSAHDPVALAAAALLMLAAALSASLSPALRAARTDPVTVLRADA